MKNVNNYELSCEYDTRKSFYGKAMVQETTKSTNGLKVLKRLYSYDIPVAEVELDTVKNLISYKYLGQWTATTTRHQKEFFKQNDLSDKEIKALFKVGFLEKGI